ncbi:MAG: HEAT repeat domain-containing protein [Methylovulum sp.]|jgi:hypothetical protein|nr:HEAT repeat domain-containing protein [Methylovulum sp.]
MLTQYFFALYLLFVAPYVLADMIEISAAKQLIKVHDTSLYTILNTIQQHTGIQLHYSDIPDVTLSVACQTSALSELLSCLLTPYSNWIVRYSKDELMQKSSALPVEIWLINATAPALAFTPIQKIATLAAPIKVLSPSIFEGTVNQRLEALSLLGKNTLSNADIHQTLTTLLNDENAEIRARSLQILAEQNDVQIAEFLHKALEDSDVSVRLTAVDYAGKDVQLLQQALNDQNATVRSYAEIKLEYSYIP